MQTVHFDEETHKYTVLETGEELPSVTHILKAEGYLPVYPETSDVRTAMLRGTYVHKACDLLDAGLLDWGALDTELVPYVEAYASFIRDSEFRVRICEVPMMHRSLRYSGTLDREGQLPGFGERDQLYIDLKTGSYLGWHALQLAGYALLARQSIWLPKPPEVRRAVLCLKNNGRYKLVECNDQSDAGVFIGAVSGYRWKAAHLKGAA